MFERFGILAGFFVALFACAPSSESLNNDLHGAWVSEQVTLDRGEFVEIYVFEVVIEKDLTGVLDISYWAENSPEGKMGLRQRLSVSIDDTENTILLTGADPVQTSGPPIEGVYESDQLICSLIDAEMRLDCNWGSDGHGQPIKVHLKKAYRKMR